MTRRQELGNSVPITKRARTPLLRPRAQAEEQSGRAEELRNDLIEEEHTLVGAELLDSHTTILTRHCKAMPPYKGERCLSIV